MQNHWLGAWAGSLIAIALGWILSIPFFGETLQHGSYDWPFSFRNRSVPPEIIIIYQDEESHLELKQPFDASWDLKVYAQLLRRLKADGSRVVLFDLFFSQEPTNAQDAVIFGDAIREHGKVVMLDHYSESGGIASGMAVRHSLPILATNAAATGIDKVLPNQDGKVRQLFTGRSHGVGGQRITVFTWEAAALERAPVTLDPSGWEKTRWLNYYGPPLQIDNVSFYRALSKPPGFFKDRVVLIGTKPGLGYTGAGRDTFDSMFIWGVPKFPGVEIQATTLANLLRSEWLRRAPLFEFVILTFTGAVIGFLLARFRPLLATTFAFVLALLVFATACFTAWYFRFWYPWAIVVFAQIPAAWAWAILYHWVKSHLENQFLEQSLSLYLSPKHIKNIRKNPELLRQGGVQQKISILFSDIANFSKISDRMEADDLVKLLNAYYDEAIGCVHSTDGTVIKLIGDAIFAVWNAPYEQTDHYQRACQAALRLRDRLIDFDSKHRGPPLRTRVGLHAGTACVGNIGSAERFDYTAIGDAVNLASRLEGFNKVVGTSVLVTRDLQKHVEDTIVTRPLGHFRFKGLDQVVEVHELISECAQEAESRPWRDTFAEGVHRFQRRSFDVAEIAFQKTLALRKDDGPSLFYLETIKGFGAHKLPSDWTGEIDLKEK
jgi:adenylate cyclase